MSYHIIIIAEMLRHWNNSHILCDIYYAHMPMAPVECVAINL